MEKLAMWKPSAATVATENYTILTGKHLTLSASVIEIIRRDVITAIDKLVLSLMINRKNIRMLHS